MKEITLEKGKLRWNETQKKLNSVLQQVATYFVRFLTVLQERVQALPLTVQNSLRPYLKSLEQKMIGPIEKGIEKARLQRPKDGVYEDIDLTVLPKYICFKAAMLQNKLVLQHVILALVAVLAIHFVTTRWEIYSLYGQLRSKEYILAPGVQDFTPASPQSVPDSHVASAVTQFLSLMGNVTAANIDEQYEALSGSMDNKLKVRFLAEASSWMKKVKEEGISELLTVNSREIRSNRKGLYQVTALGRRDTYIGSEYLGHVDEAVEMILELVPPKDGKRWYLQINELTRQSMDAYRTKKNF